MVAVVVAGGVGSIVIAAITLAASVVAFCNSRGRRSHSYISHSLESQRYFQANCSRTTNLRSVSLRSAA